MHLQSCKQLAENRKFGGDVYTSPLKTHSHTLKTHIYMYIPEEMKVNKFVSVHLPENANYFARFGYQIPQSQLYTGDERAVMPQNKVDSINDYMEYAKQMSNDNYNKDEQP